jgi:hypothetical protein
LLVAGRFQWAATRLFPPINLTAEVQHSDERNGATAPSHAGDGPPDDEDRHCTSTGAGVSGKTRNE